MNQSKKHITDYERETGQRCFTVEEIAEKWGLSVAEVEKAIEDEPGIIFVDEDGWIVGENRKQ